MARKRDRFFAGFGAFLFLASACAGTIYVIFQSNADSKTTQASTDQSKTCSDNKSETALAAPEVYKPEGAVTELQSTDLEAGSGATAKAGDCLVVKYYGTLATTGVKFDEDFTDTTGFAFTLGQGQVISGWDKGMVGMQVGGTRRLVIPAADAYGSQSPSSAIPANSDLVFVVKLLRIQQV
jgi:FKBP-type peptidyl-prolyl cis-trans isomerase